MTSINYRGYEIQREELTGPLGGLLIRWHTTIAGEHRIHEKLRDARREIDHVTWVQELKATRAACPPQTWYSGGKEEDKP